MMSPPPAVLVTDGEQRAALAAVRSLGRAGYSVFACSSLGSSIAGASRHCLSEARVPNALESPIAFAGAIRELARRWTVKLVLPMTDAAALALLPERERFPGICIPMPSAEQFRRLSDKSLLLSMAPSVGLAVPEQRTIDSPEAWAAVPVDSIRFPVVIKPARSVGQSDGRLVKLTVRHAASVAELERHCRELGAAAYPLLVQQRVVGSGVGIFVLLWKGELLATFSHRRIREKPPAGGVSVYRESIATDPILLQRSRALLESFDWCGVAMVEFKIDEGTGVPYLMEANGRFWGSLQLAIDAGVDFPRLLVEAALGGGHTPAPVRDYRHGVRSRWWWGDVDHLLARLRRSADELSLPPGAPSRWQTIREVMVPWRPGDRSEVLRLDDPKPFLRETAQWFGAR